MSFFKRLYSSTHRALHAFSKPERTLFGLLILVAIVMGGILFARALQIQTVEVPVHGGSLTEGVIGIPRFINPILATSSSELDLTHLVYAGLMRKVAPGQYIPELAQYYEVSEDGRTFTFHLDPEAVFHDGRAVTTNDVLFTIDLLRSPKVRSPYIVQWEGVAVNKIDDHTIEFILKEPFAGFIDATTLGILPEHIWSQIPDEGVVYSVYNVRPIGAGPYRLSGIDNSRDGLPDRYHLRSNSDYVLGEPYVSRMTMRVFPSAYDRNESLSRNIIDSAHGVTPTDKQLKQRQVVHTPLPRLFGLFIHKDNGPIGHDTGKIRALESAIDREALIEEVLDGYGSPLVHGVPLNLSSHIGEGSSTHEDVIAAFEKEGFTYDEASGTLTSSAGTPLLLRIATSNAPRLVATAENLQAQLERYGIDVELDIYESGRLSEDIIRNRDFEILLFGQSINHDTNLFAFWHSSQRSDPGRNITDYTNSRTDRLLSEAQGELDSQARAEIYREFADTLYDDQPAVYLYAPDFVYVVPDSLHMPETLRVDRPHERFGRVHQWYTETQRIWKFMGRE